MKRWRALSNEAKRFIFIIACIAGLMWGGATFLLIAAGDPNAFVAMAVITTGGLFAAGVIWLAGRLFPDGGDRS